MVEMITPRDMIWKSIEENEFLKNILNLINSKLSEYPSFSFTSGIKISLSIDRLVNYDETTMLKYALAEFGWSFNQSYHGNEKGYNYVLILTPKSNGSL